MAKLSKEEVLKLSKLARLRLSEAEVAKYQSELSAILEYIEMLSSVDVSGLKPTYQVTGLVNVTRPDVVIDYKITQQELLKNVPAVLNGQIKVWRII